MADQHDEHLLPDDAWAEVQRQAEQLDADRARGAQGGDE